MHLTARVIHDIADFYASAHRRGRRHYIFVCAYVSRPTRADAFRWQTEMLSTALQTHDINAIHVTNCSMCTRAGKTYVSNDFLRFLSFMVFKLLKGLKKYIFVKCFSISLLMVQIR